MISGSAGPSGTGSSIWSRWRDSFGEAHLTVDAVVAYVDGELAAGPSQRAAEHVERCLRCAAEVAEQRRTRGRLRGADTPGVPSALLSALRAIPGDAAERSSVPMSAQLARSLGPGAATGLSLVKETASSSRTDAAPTVAGEAPGAPPAGFAPFGQR